MKLAGRCPSLEELQRFAERESTSNRVAEHVAACDICRQAMPVIINDARSAHEIRALNETGMTDAQRRRLLLLCRRIARAE